MQKFTYHCHTNFSDGTSTPQEMIEEALKIGFTEIGFTDHLTFHRIKSLLKNYLIISEEDIADEKKRWRHYLKDVKDIAQKYPIRVKVGAEVDFFSYSGWLEEFKSFIKDLEFDYLISGTHYSETNNPYDGPVSVFKIKDFPEHEQQALIKRHFRNIEKAIESGLFSFIAHIDFIRWTQLVGENDYVDEKMAVVEALSKTQTPFEINTKGINSVGDFYPAKWLLKELVVRNVPVVISDDAHNTTQLGRHFEKAEELLKDLGCKNRWKLD